MKERKWLMSGAIVWREVDGEAVILGGDGNSYFSLNETGTMMWKLINKGLSAESIIAAAAREYGVTRGTIKKDYDGLIKTLVKEKLLTDAGKHSKTAKTG